ncbi:hypothetical protein Vretimale_13165 [Volvox reticuliferus]|uniref:Protein kinase domain-containing protein n=1 Tax=Volvox reticuliferus TaxID=1737510 RepID=A0A8J4GJU5_9CHLO|nr:hypothetical protein Vretifemale_14113 [Volvox reticuliferus]GIM09336.1 hypothetical protein Vretimale_13165 [Volvox reticuliferus]
MKTICTILVLTFLWKACLGACEGINGEQLVRRSLFVPKERQGRLPLSSNVANVSDGYQFIAALLDPSIDNIKLTAPVVDVPLDAWEIPGREVPIVITRNLTTEGDEVDWPLLRLNYVKDKMRLEGNVTWTIRFVFIHGAFGENIYREQGFSILSPTAPNQTSEMLLGPAAVSFRLCFPASTSSANIRLVDRPSQYPGKQTIQFGAPMTGCLNGSSVPPLHRCWTNKANIVDMAGLGYRIQPASDLAVSTNIFFWMRNVTGLCERTINANCLANRTVEPLVCYKETEQQYRNATDFLEDSKPQGDPSGATQPAPVPQQADTIPTSGDHRHSKAVVGAVAGAAVASSLVIAVMVAMVTVLWRRRRRSRAYCSTFNIGFAPTNAFEWQEMCPGPVAGGAGLDTSFSMKLQRPSEPDQDFSAVQSKSKGIVQTALAAAECDLVTPDTEPTPNLDLHVRLVDTKIAPTSHISRADIKSSTANSSSQKSGVGAATGGSREEEMLTAGRTNASATAGAQEWNLNVEGDAGPQTAVTNYNDSFLAAITCRAVCADLDDASGGGGSSAGGSSDGGVVELSQVVRGKGAFGRVVEAMYNGQPVAVKLMACDWPWGEPTEAFTRCFAQELQVLSRCQHPNVVRLLAASVDAPRLCLVLELMETSLERVIHGDPTAPLMPLPKVLHIAINVAAALAYLHPTIIHRDLKPANVLINDPQSDQPVVKLTDFGLARLRVTVMPTEHPDAGTPAYMAPECFDVENNVVTDKADIFSLGVLLWEMLMGRRPWARLANPLAVALMVAYSGARLSLNDLGEDRCPPKLGRLIHACWERDPARRPAAAEVVKQLALILQQIQHQPPRQPSSIADQ